MARYIQGKKIGSGTYSDVFEAVDTETNKIVALKKTTLNNKEGMPSTTLREISILKSLQHKNIIDLKQVIHRDDFLIMVLEFVDYDLMKYIKTFGMKYNLVDQLIYAVAFIHKNNVIHRDLKPANILVSKEGDIKLADFGLARVVSSVDSNYSSEVVTLWYRPPELLQGIAFYGFEVDIWSLGCIIYEMITGQPLFQAENKEKQMELISKLNTQHLESELLMHYNAPLSYSNIVKKCLNKNPQMRISINEIILLLDDDSSNT